jgi:site-specific DNA-methyltransferase (adenine-specific)
VKQTFVMGRQDYPWKHEPILYGWSPGAAHTWIGDRKQSTVLEFNKPARNGEHPTMKPVELIEYCMSNSVVPGGLVLDLFGGSGSTLIACEKTGRNARLVELDPKYCDVIVARWEKYTGQKATRQPSE